MLFNQYPYINENDLNLDYILKHVKEFMALVTNMVSWRTEHEAEYLALKKLVDDLYAGNFDAGFADALTKWYEQNIVDIIGEYVNLVVFNITDDGYFVAYIPESWDEIQFGTTGLDTTADTDYGHLVLSYEASTNAY